MATPPAQLAKAALRRLLEERRDPTPDEYAKAYKKVAQEAGEDWGSDGAASEPVPLDEAGSQDPTAGDWVEAIRRLVKGMERTDPHWTLAQKKESLSQLLERNGRDVGRLHQRLGALLTRWGGHEASALAAAGEDNPELATLSIQPTSSATSATISTLTPTAADLTVQPGESAQSQTQSIRGMLSLLGETAEVALPAEASAERAVRVGLARHVQKVCDASLDSAASEARAAAAMTDFQSLCQEAGDILRQRHRLVQDMGRLCQELSQALGDFAEEGSWVAGQGAAMATAFDTGLTARAVRGVSQRLEDTRRRQQVLRQEREVARKALQQMIAGMLSEMAEMGQQTGRFSDQVGSYVSAVASADSIESLAGAIGQMLSEGRAVTQWIHQARERLDTEHSRALELSSRVAALESELQRLSQEVSTDALTQVANRRGLQSAFEAEVSRIDRDDTGLSSGLSVALLDIDNFKKLNDSLGHAAGDQALKSLAARIQEILRPTDAVARFGGEEFVILLPETPVDAAEIIMNRLQRSLTSALFIHEQGSVFVTFSAGLTLYRPGESLDEVLERADRALYRAKNEGKNRCCLA